MLLPCVLVCLQWSTVDSAPFAAIALLHFPDGRVSSTTSSDASRLATASRDMEYTLSLDEVGVRYASAGHPRTLRTLQRYCASGHLDAQKVASTALGDKYLVTPESVARHIAQIEELQALNTVAPGRDVPRPFATSVAEGSEPTLKPSHRSTGNDAPRQATTGESEPSRAVRPAQRFEVVAIDDTHVSFRWLAEETWAITNPRN